MTETPRNDIAALAGLALAGIAAYAGYRAVDAERRIKDPDAKPLSEHLSETARDDLSKIRDGLRDLLDKATVVLKDVAESAQASATSMAEELAERAKRFEDGIDAPAKEDRPPV
jgi:methyl-accepting chemotaxis protein